MEYTKYKMQIVRFSETDSFIAALINSGDGESVDSVPGDKPGLCDM